MPGGDTSPFVMLSPTAVNRVPRSMYVGLTVTRNWHVAARLRLSVAVHVTDVGPAGNVSPDIGVHVVVIGVVPPVTTGGGNVTGNAALGESTTTSAGQLIRGASTGGGGGGVGPLGGSLPHATATAHTHSVRRIPRRTRASLSPPDR